MIKGYFNVTAKPTFPDFVSRKYNAIQHASISLQSDNALDLHSYWVRQYNEVIRRERVGQKFQVAPKSVSLRFKRIFEIVKEQMNTAHEFELASLRVTREALKDVASVTQGEGGHDTEVFQAGHQTEEVQDGLHTEVVQAGLYTEEVQAGHNTHAVRNIPRDLSMDSPLPSDWLLPPGPPNHILNLYKIKHWPMVVEKMVKIRWMQQDMYLLNKCDTTFDIRIIMVTRVWLTESPGILW
ncbi:uncharacterized protein EV154DRAFT_325095 [Mucor mucedo]|uniref:uncharacterized protein n=1 Tax=Mucor mucedo TaxID=29922 RepID=UPI002220F4BB|nr:uncharacterized protein EV154DRAFT_325095 [Mucor mucedo]KAI7887965.1 hypothetical protein EV154DRAFT_325095 [Mucor mucedo]